MMCPFCRDKNGESFKTKVIETRSFWEPNKYRYYLERRRECKHCGERFTTMEYSPQVKST